MADIRAVIAEVREVVARDVAAWESNYQDRNGFAPSPDVSAARGEQAIVEAVEATVRSLMASGRPALSDDEEDMVIEAVRSRVFGHGVLDSLLNDPSIEEIMANGHDNVTVVRVGGVSEQGPALADSAREFEDTIRRLAATAGKTERRFDDAQPYLDLRLPDGSRLHAIKQVTNRLTVTIRRHGHTTMSLDELVELGTITPPLAHFLHCAVAPPLPCAIMVAGGTATGKTTFLRGLISSIPPTERLVVIEDSSELSLELDPERSRHCIEMEVRQPNLEGVGGISMKTLGEQALRMRPDRVIVGESRRGDEVRTVLQALNSGHEGSMSTIHSDSALSALSKMQTSALQGEDALSMEASAQLISLVLHLVLHLIKRPDGQRIVSSVREVVGADGPAIHTTEIFALDPNGHLRPTEAGVSSQLLERLRVSGFDHMTMFDGAGAR